MLSNDPLFNLNTNYASTRAVFNASIPSEPDPKMINSNLQVLQTCGRDDTPLSSETLTNPFPSRLARTKVFA